jgi:hypothetical protein
MYAKFGTDRPNPFSFYEKAVGKISWRTLLKQPLRTVGKTDDICDLLLNRSAASNFPERLAGFIFRMLFFIYE